MVHHTVCGTYYTYYYTYYTYYTAEAGTRTVYVQCVGAREQAALCLRCVWHAGDWYLQYGGPGAYVSA